MPLYIHTCISEVSGIAMMINCIVSVLFGLWGSSNNGANTSDAELNEVPWMFKYFRSYMLLVSTAYNSSRFIYECVRGDVMLISLLFRVLLNGYQLAEHLFLCRHYARFYVQQELAAFFWTRGFVALSVFCGLGIFSGLEGVNGHGVAMLEHILWSLVLAVLIAGGVVWGRWQPGGITRTKVGGVPSLVGRKHRFFCTSSPLNPPPAPLAPAVLGFPRGLRPVLPRHVRPHRGEPQGVCPTRHRVRSGHVLRPVFDPHLPPLDRPRGEHPGRRRRQPHRHRRPLPRLHRDHPLPAPVRPPTLCSV